MSSLVQRIEVSRLRVDVFDEAVARHATVLSDVSFVLLAGQGLGITGESGSGKTTLSLALGGLSPPGARVWADRIELGFQGGEGGATGTLGFAHSGDLTHRLHDLRGRHIFTMFQEPRASLNPYRTIGWQLERCLRSRRGSGTASLTPGAPGLRNTHGSPASALAEVGLEPDLLRSYPHELSTGMCQRVFLAMASLLGAGILIADEPFASVDSSTRQRLAELVRKWMKTRGVILLLVSHDLDLLRCLTDQTLVIYRGQVAELGATADVLACGESVHPYTWLLEQVAGTADVRSMFQVGTAGGRALSPCCFASRCQWAEPTVCVEAIPVLREDPHSERTGMDSTAVRHRLRCVRHPLDMQISGDAGPHSRADRSPAKKAGQDASEADDAPGHLEVLRVSSVVKQFRTGWVRRRVKTVLEDVSFSLFEGERLGIMGPTGQGKTTLARVILGLLDPSCGGVELGEGAGLFVVSHRTNAARVQFRRRVQLLHQDADLVLDPAQRVGDALIEAYRVFSPLLTRRHAYRLAAQLFDELALPVAMMEAYPYRLSGGERKRVAVARVLAALGCPVPAQPGDPWRVLVLDEPTAGIDVVLQTILSRFLVWVQHRLRLCYLVISHDESFVRQFCHRALRLERGRIGSANPPGERPPCPVPN